jgi:hypothetical protein
VLAITDPPRVSSCWAIAVISPSGAGRPSEGETDTPAGRLVCRNGRSRCDPGLIADRATGSPESTRQSVTRLRYSLRPGRVSWSRSARDQPGFATEGRADRVCNLGSVWFVLRRYGYERLKIYGPGGANLAAIPGCTPAVCACPRTGSRPIGADARPDAGGGGVRARNRGAHSVCAETRAASRVGARDARRTAGRWIVDSTAVNFERFVTVSLTR